MHFDFIGGQFPCPLGDANKASGEPLSSPALAGSSDIKRSIAHAAPLIVRVTVLSGIKTLPLQSSRTS